MIRLTGDQDYGAMVTNAFAEGAIAEIGKDGKITHVNRMFSDIANYTVEELIGKEYEMLLHFPTTGQLRDIIKQKITSGKIFSGVLKVQRRDGDYHWVLATIVPVKNRTGEIVKYVDVRYPIASNAMAEYLFKMQAAELELSC